MKQWEESFLANGYSSAEMKLSLQPRGRYVNTNQETKKFSGYASEMYLKFFQEVKLKFFYNLNEWFTLKFTSLDTRSLEFSLLDDFNTL